MFITYKLYLNSLFLKFNNAFPSLGIAKETGENICIYVIYL